MILLIPSSATRVPGEIHIAPNLLGEPLSSYLRPPRYHVMHSVSPSIRASAQQPPRRFGGTKMHAIYRTNQQFHFRHSRCVSRLFHVGSCLTMLECVYCRATDLSANHTTPLSPAFSTHRVIMTRAPSFVMLHTTCTSIGVEGSHTIILWNFSLVAKVQDCHIFLSIFSIQCQELFQSCSAL
jgi:hypothetical protein